jgi:sugar phosphate isomerase/epimerase
MRLGMVVVYERNLRLLDEFGLRRAEFGLIEREARGVLEKFIADRGIGFGVHCPLFKPEDHPENNVLLAALADGDEDRRLASMKLMEGAISDAADVGGEYIVFHIQRPENFGGDNPDDFSERAALDSARRSCERLLAAAREKNIPIFIENLFRNRSFHAPATYRALLDSFPEIGFCLDIGHLEVDSREFGFPFDEFMDAVMPNLKDVHLQNSNSTPVVTEPRSWKYPVHPAQTVVDGWLDIPSILTKIFRAKPDCYINFESRIILPDEEQIIREGIEWIKNLIPEIEEENMQ